ncbi:DUF948 domain-containing protein [candidate division KSB1 bacterium]|nr:DUF948 domain-containing protein [candidate division KSB1 bacterium]
MLIEISVVIIAVFIVVFVIGMLIVLLQVRRTSKEAEKFLDTTRQQIVPVTHDIVIILNDVRKVISSVERQALKVETGVDALRDTAVNVKNFEEDIQKRIEQPILEMTVLITAIARILNSLFRFGKHKK